MRAASGLVGIDKAATSWQNTHDRVWLGESYWANPMEDWRVVDGAAECRTSGGNRNIHLVTHQLTDPSGNIEMSVSIDRGNGFDNPTFGGWYVLGSYFLTGESRGYSGSQGRFTRVKVRRPIDEGGRGAWELTFRYSHLDLTNGGVEGGKQDIATFGINWYAMQNLRFMANYLNVVDLDRSGTATDGDEPLAVQVRTQVNF